ncbi:MAG TPA: efflux RND transporter periplasmic adaptor subunit [Planctomycetaceae bacterium]|nr:efflux RND transporter periplasmic adaptor subunit [Planctomycetaceae bacterium]
MNWKSMFKTGLAIVLLAIAGGSAYWVNAHVLNADRVDADIAAASDEPAPAPVPVQAAKVQRVTLRPALELVGNVMAIPERIAMISPQLGGWVTELGVHEGQIVKAGEPLAQLDERTAKTDIQRTSAIVAEKAAALKRLKRGYLPQEMEVARQDRDKAKATADGLRSELKALEDLRRRGEISPVQYDTKVKMLESADAALASADAHSRLIEEGTPAELVEEAQAFLEAAQADEEHAKLTLQWCTIASPIDGVVTLLAAHQGQYFAQALPLATVIDMSNVFVQLRIPSRDFGKVTIGTKVNVQLTSIPDRTFHGTINRISGEADPLTGNVNMFALVENEAGQLRPGLSCDVYVWLPEIPNALAVPVSAIGDHAGTPVVTLIRDGKTQETVVELGAETREFFQVTSGLAEGDIVATSGGYGLPDGCPVEILESASDNSAAMSKIEKPY